MKEDFAVLLRRRMKEFSVSADHLAFAVGVNRNSVFNWLKGDTEPFSKTKTDILRFFATREKPNGETSWHSHPHEKLVTELLNNSIPAGLRIELVGLPGLLKTKLLDDLHFRLDNIVERNHLYFRDLALYSSFPEFWNSLGRRIIGGERTYYDPDTIAAALHKQPIPLLLDDADVFLKNVEQRGLKPFEFGAAASQWIKEVVSLPTAVIITSSIACGDFVGLVSGGSNSYFLERGFDQWYSKAAWNFWIATILKKPQKKLFRIQKLSAQIPVVFLESLKHLNAEPSADPNSLIEKTQRQIAKSIWSKIPARHQAELITNHFELSPHSRLFKALKKGGIVTRTASDFKNSLRVPSWMSTWKTESGI